MFDVPEGGVTDEFRKKSIAILIDVFAGGKKGHAKEMVGKKLEEVSSSEYLSLSILLAEGGVVARLKGILVDAESQYRIQAARILKNLCTNRFGAEGAKEAMIDAVPKV